MSQWSPWLSTPSHVTLQQRTLARDGVSREVPCSALKGETWAAKQALGKAALGALFA